MTEDKPLTLEDLKKLIPNLPQQEDSNISKSRDNGKALSLQDVYRGNKDKTLLVHMMVNGNKEVSKPLRKKIYDLDFDWNKRTHEINHDKIITDFQGKAHYYHDVNDTIGSLSFHKTEVKVSGNCLTCGGDLNLTEWIDAQNERNLTRRRNIQGIWGIDNTSVILLMIIGIVALVMAVALFYVVGAWQQTQNQLNAYLPKVTQHTTNIPQLLLGGIILNG